MSHPIELTTRNFAEASLINGKDEFSFVIGDEKVNCHKFVAAFLSHSVSQDLTSDPLLDTFNIETQCKENQTKQIQNQIKENLQKLIHGENIDITEEDLQKFSNDLTKITKNATISELSNSKISSLIILFQSLNNTELKDQLYKLIIQSISANNKKESKNFTKEDISNKVALLQKLENFFNIIENHGQFKICIKKYLNQEYKEIIDDIASHFYELDESALNEMNDDIIDSILSSEKLKIKSEDSLLQALIGRRSHILSKGEDTEIEGRRFFIEKVQFENLSEKSIELFLSEFSLGQIDELIWDGIKKRLVLPVRAAPSKRCKTDVFSYDSNNPFNGILQHLTAKTKGNIQSNKTVEITCSDLCCGKYESLVDFSSTSGHVHVNGSPSPRWLLIDFKTRKIEVSSYLIKSCNKSSYGNIYALKSWKVEVSNDGSNWEMIDKRDNVSELNGELKMHVFNVEKKYEPFRFIRIITDQDNWYCGDGFVIGKLELFGSIIE